MNESTASEPVATAPMPASAEQPATTPLTNSAAAASPATTTSPSAPTTGTEEAPPPRRTYPRLVIAGGPLIGPHTFGNEECRSEERRCETHGTFFGFGLNVELRARVWKPLYVHARGIFVGNVSPRDPVHRGLYGGGLGFGAYGRRIFGRAEYLLVDTFGDDTFARPFGDDQVGRDQWRNHAGLISAGARLPLPRRVAAELWGGLMIGPHSTRTIPDEPIDRSTMLTFLIGLNISYDLVPDRE